MKGTLGGLVTLVGIEITGLPNKASAGSDYESEGP